MRQVSGHDEATAQRYYKIQRINESAKCSLEIADMIDPTGQSLRTPATPAVPKRILDGSLTAASTTPTFANTVVRRSLNPLDFGRLHSQVSQFNFNRLSLVGLTTSLRIRLER
jgi:hypothetical protein